MHKPTNPDPIDITIKIKLSRKKWQISWEFGGK